MPAPGRDGGGWGYVGQAFVRAEHRDAGVGRLLLDAALAEARALGFDRVVLNPSARSVPFYRRAGFVPADGLLVHPLR
jgi:GNAT superfamily N-acetyltransferase